MPVIKIIVKLFLSMFLISAVLLLFGIGLDFNREYERTRKELKSFLCYLIFAFAVFILIAGMKKIW